jgi:6-pyruvoyltetrahydropterin/6-carboxytetrahydropterin synthase
MMTLTRRYRFSASHRLHAPSLAESENARIYGKCNNPYGHGHDYVLEVSVRGPLDEATGRIVDLDSLDALVRAEVLNAFDHRNLNLDAPGFADMVPTTENLAIEIRRRLAKAWERAFPAGAPELDRIRIQETKRNIFELA